MDVRDALVMEDEEPPGAAGITRSDQSYQAKRPARRRVHASFRARFYPDTTRSNWSDWRWQLRNRIRTAEELERFLRPSDDEYTAIQAGIDTGHHPLPFAVTPYYLSLLDPVDPEDPLRKTVIPTTAERVYAQEESKDPLNEEQDSPVPGIVHRYPDRVLFLVTDRCSTYCRYCTRSRRVGDHSISRAERTDAIEYIRSHREIRDVLISGGDPLTMSEEVLDGILREVRAIQHVEIIRIGTKTPVVLPMRITSDLVRVLRRYHPLYLSIHATHPREVTPEMGRACERLADAGIPLGSQTVLLKGINDDPETMRDLMHRLLRVRVKPYYLYQCDPIPGSRHFRTSVDRGLEIIRSLRGYTSGYAVPHYVIDAPGGGGKIPILPDYRRGRDGDDLLLENYAGRIYRYPDGNFAASDARGEAPE